MSGHKPFSRVTYQTRTNPESDFLCNYAHQPIDQLEGRLAHAHNAYLQIGRAGRLSFSRLAPVFTLADANFV